MVVGRCGGILGRRGGPGTVEIPEMAVGAVMWKGVRSYSGNRKPVSRCLREWKNPGAALGSCTRCGKMGKCKKLETERLFLSCRTPEVQDVAVEQVEATFVIAHEF